MKIKTIRATELAQFDRELEEYLNDGWVIVGDIRTLSQKSFVQITEVTTVKFTHFVTLKKFNDTI